MPSNHPELDPLMSLDQVLPIVGVSKSKVYSLVQSGLFPEGVKVGRSRRWRQSEIADWLEFVGEGGLDA